MNDLRRSQWLDLASLDLRRNRSGRPRRRWPVALVVVVALFALPFAGWHLVPRASSGVVIVDKTVPRPGGRKHARLMWWLTHVRVPTPGGDWWDATRDYVGFDPVAARGTLLDSAKLAGARLAYLADAYGVYSGDTAASATAPAAAPAEARSTVVFAGVQLGEARALSAFRARGGAVVAEFNALENPTTGTPAGAILEQLLGAHYLGWIGRGYDDLASNDEVPTWMRAKWLRRHRTPWTFSGPGYVMFGENDDRIAVVLGEHVTGPHALTFEVELPLDPLIRGVTSGAEFRSWVSGIEATDSSVVLASWMLHVDTAARAQLAREGFPLRFPAIVRRTTGPLAAYITADLSDAPVALPYVQRTVLLDWWRARRVNGAVGDEGDLDFFWRVAAPVWDATLRLSDSTRR